jgi:hypothetical protein
MRRSSTRNESVRPLALVVTVLLGLALLFCVDMVHGACMIALGPSLVPTALLIAYVAWWLVPSIEAPTYAVSLHLPDPPPKSSALL